MALNELLLPELDMELANTRKVLERLPVDKLDWRPHEKSGSLVWLAKHLANLPGWGTLTLVRDSYDMAPDAKIPDDFPGDSVREAILAVFDHKAAELRAALIGTSDEAFQHPWTFSVGGKPLFTQPRYAVLRGMFLNHLIHHRAQFCVYLRMNNVPLPAIYGPTADEQFGEGNAG